MIRHRSQSSTLPIHYTPHTFRRSCATELIRNNANLHQVKELLGHASVESLKRYTKLTIVDLKKVYAECHPREKDD
jgi:site-specific recombinase XerD